VDTFVVTGDIDAMWLRDSTNQILPYVEFVAKDPKLSLLIRGVINRQVKNVLLDVYANAFNKGFEGGPWMSDETSTLGFLGTRKNAMTMQLHERKYELDSICAVIKLSYTYYKALNDLSFAGPQWLQAMQTIVDTIRWQQKSTEEESNPAYRFSRLTTVPSDTLQFGRGGPAKRTGMSKSPFRPSGKTLPYSLLLKLC